MKVLATASVSDPKGRILTIFQYLREELSHGRYMGRPLPPSLHNILATQDSDRAAAARCARKRALVPTIVGRVALDVVLGSAGGSSAPPGQQREGEGGNPCPNPHLIQRLCLFPGENTRGVCRNVTLSILGGAAFCKHWHLGLSCFRDFPWKGSHIHPLVVVVVDKVSAAIAMNRSPAVGAVGST